MPRRNGGSFQAARNARIPQEEADAYRAVLGDFAPAFIVLPDFRRDPCAYCGRPGPNTLDHIVPWVEARKSEYSRNATAACTACNYKKGSTPLLQFVADILAEQSKR